MATQVGEANNRIDEERSIIVAEKKKVRLGIRLHSDAEEAIPNHDKTRNGVSREKSDSNTPSSYFRRHACGLWSSVLSNFQWVPQNNSWSKWKPVIRCALAAWISGILFVIPQTEKAMGQASFLILIAAFLSPPSDPFIAVLERELMVMVFVSVAWSWACLGIKLADLARWQHVPAASLTAIVSGQYIEAAPSVIFAIFIFIGSAFFLYLKARQGPGPFLFASVFACICIDITLTTAVLFPYPFYAIGQAIAIPLAMHSAIALITSALVFPSSISHQFTTRLQGTFGLLRTSLELHRTLLRTPTDSPDFSHKAIVSSVGQAEGSLIGLAAAARLLKADVSYSQFAPSDFKEIHNLTRQLVVRANGMTVFFHLLDLTREMFPFTPAPSKLETPSATTPGNSRPPSPDHNTHNTHTRKPEDRSTVFSLPTHRRRHHRHSPSQSESIARLRHHGHHNRSHTHHSHHNLLHNSLMHLAVSRNPRPERAVGVFESNRYLSHESTHHSDPDSVRSIARTVQLLNESADELLGGCIDALQGAHTWLGQVRKGRWKFWDRAEEKQKQREAKIERYEEIKRALEDALDRFRNDKRHKVLEPYLIAFDPNHVASSSDDELPPHRYLFHCYVYQYHLLQFTIILVGVLTEILRLEKLRTDNRLWTPTVPVRKLLSWNTWEASEQQNNFDDEDPDIVPGVAPEWIEDLEVPRRRDPDALPPSNFFEVIMNYIYRGAVALRGGNTLFAIKAGLLTVILCIPSFLKASGSFAYLHKSVWAVFMGQLTIARFRGDTAFGFVTRILSTFFGCIVGLVIWYISAGDGKGNPYSLSAVFAVCFLFFFFARLYWPGPPMTNLIFFVTALLVVGYSYQDAHLTFPSSPGWGFSVAWRRFVLVTVGVFGAFVFSFFPPSTTLRCYQRTSLATSSAELGAIYCSIVSLANSSNHDEDDSQHITQSLIAIRSKLNRSLVLRTNVIYEYSLRGSWPTKRYHQIFKIQLEVAFLLSHLLSVVERLEPAWLRALLRRTRLLDPGFQGDVLAIISMISNSLRSGEPLPQITPCPLLDRFMARHHGLNVIHQESDDDYGLPRTLTIDTLKNEQYLIFCVGVTTTYAIITRLDRLMVAAKEIVGEQYHIHGIGLRVGKDGGLEMESRTDSLIPQNV